MPRHCSFKQIVEATGLDKSTVWRHRQKGYIKPESIEGARGLRFTDTTVQKWLSKYQPEIAAAAFEKLFPGRPA